MLPTPRSGSPEPKERTGCREALGWADSPTLPPHHALRAQHTHPTRVLGAVLCALLCVAAQRSARVPQRAVYVTIQAQARFLELETSRFDAQSIELRARLVDDAGAALGRVSVGVEGFQTSRPLAWVNCQDAARRAARRNDSVLTDADGRLCVRVLKPGLEGSVELTFRGDSLHLPAKAQLPLHLARSDLQLAFLAPSLELDLDRPSQRLELSVAGGPPEVEAAPGATAPIAPGSTRPSAGGAPALGVAKRGTDFGHEVLEPEAPYPPIELRLHDGPRELAIEGSDWLRSGHRLSVNVRSDQLGSAGPARLVAQFAGSAQVAASRAETVAVRVARVVLSAEVASVDETGIELQVSAQTRAGPPTSGSVEATLSGATVASSPLIDGVARLRVPMTTPPPSAVLVRYSPDDAWWLPTEPITVAIDGPAVTSEPARWPWLVLLAPIGYLCLRALQRPALRQPRRRPPPVRPTRAFVETPIANASGWSGTVRDAHEGSPIAGARVEALLPSLRATPSDFSTTTDTAGYFSLPALPEPIPEGARLHVSAALHTEVARPLPPQGRVDVAMMSRRRLLLRRLVRWARSVGPPWHRSGEPTPREIVDVALRRGDIRTARWAEALEAAAFGDAAVDRAREVALRAQEPPWQQGSQKPDDVDDES